MDALDADHPVKAALYKALLERAGQIRTLAEAEGVLSSLSSLENVQDYCYKGIALCKNVIGTRCKICVLREAAI